MLQLLTTSLLFASKTFFPPDTLALADLRRAVYVGVHSAEYGGGGHYVGLAYERQLTARFSARLGIGGVHRNTSHYTVILDPATGQYQQTVESVGRYNSALLISQLRYIVRPGRQAGAGLFVGAGLQLVAEEFSEDRNSPYGYVSNIQVHVPLSTRVGYQLRKKRWLLSGSTGLDFTRRRQVPLNFQRPNKGGQDVHVTTGSDLQLGFLF
ncbi:hypothetical protein [Hymenobacter glacialis]|uniref:Uncharacterized protein n=1 Tax=Hymenobacter glacialis TaxID=1908236 RepID=A0A1G1T452_9BACT|nr:hypothetical protein [Hymenobacter glacialis]OGX85649.1 hypothetical protein BEN48_02145 [Hymenobacter glacialis]